MTREIVSSIQQTRSNNSLQPHARIEAWQLELMRSAGSGAFVLVPWLALYVGRGTKPSEAHFSPRLKTLAQKTGMNERTIRRCIARLVGVGLLQCDRITGSSRNLYRLATSAAQADLWRAAARSKASPSSSLARKRANKTMTRQRTTKPPPCLFDVETLAATVGAWKTPLLEPALFTKSQSCPHSDDAPETDAKSPPRVDNGVHPVWTFGDIPCGHLTTVSKNERENISTAKADTCEPKTTKKTVSIIQEKQTKETDNNKQQRLEKISKPHEPSSAAFVVVQNLSMSQETKPTAEQPLAETNAQYPFHRTDAFIREWVDTLDHYKLDKKMPHIAKALKEADGIPREELGKAISDKLKAATECGTPQPKAGLAWAILGRSFLVTWQEWKEKKNKQAQIEAEQLQAEKQRLQQEHNRKTLMAEQKAENERLAAIHAERMQEQAKHDAERMQEQAEHDAKPENIILRTRPQLSQLENELEQVETKYQQLLAERAAKALELESKLEQQANGALWLKNPKEWEAMRSRIKKESQKNIPTEDAEHAQQIDNITRAIANAQNTIAQAEKAQAEAA